MTDSLKLHVVLVSTRPQRAGEPIAKWFFEQARAHAGFEVELVDLKAVNLPLLDEPKHPRLGQYEHAHTKAWSAKVSEADAFVFVTPEYNYSAPASLINALDFLVREWAYKPCAFVSYGGTSAGLRSVQHAKSVVTALKMMPIPEGVAVPFFPKFMVEGEFRPESNQADAAKATLDELGRWAKALKPLRA